MKPVLVFDIETIPDVPGLRRLHDLDPALSDAEVAEMAFQQCRVKSGNDFLPHHLQRIAVISCALRSGEDIRVWSLAEPEQSEAEIIQRFFDGVEKFTPQIVSWNGGGFDLPVLHYRGLIHGVVAPVSYTHLVCSFCVAIWSIIIRSTCLTSSFSSCWKVKAPTRRIVWSATS